MKIYIDWGIEKEWVVIEGNSLPTSLPFEKLLKQIEKSDEIYLETGIPKQFIKHILDKEARLFTVDGKGIKQLRDSENIKKSDFADAILIKRFIDSGGDFREITMREFKLAKYKSLYYLYTKTTQHIVSLKNQYKAFEKEYGEENKIILEAITTNEQLKKGLLKELTKVFKSEIRLFDDIKGLGKRYIIGILLEANPENFDTKTRYLSYCGLKSKEFTKNRYNRQANSLFHESAKQVIMHKDKQYYPLYLKVKGDLEAKNLDWTKKHIDNAARNRLATFLAKETYSRLRSKRNPA